MYSGSCILSSCPLPAGPPKELDACHTQDVYMEELQVDNLGVSAIVSIKMAACYTQ